MKILLLSDTHGRLEDTKSVIKKHSDVDAYIHLGDIGFDVKELFQFHIVCGNHDRFKSLPKEMIRTYESRRILCLHGNVFDEQTLQEVLSSPFNENIDIMNLCMNTLYRNLASYAKKRECNTLFFGHTHHQVYKEVDGVVLINPGSLYYGTPFRGYAIVHILQDNIHVDFYETKSLGNTET